METQTAEEPGTTTAERLRHALVDALRYQGKVHIGRVEQALRTVPRHLFVPAVSLDEAYANDAVYTKHDPAGVSISAASQPAVVAMMLEQLQVEPGHRVLEIGAGTGYNAGLLAHLVGSGGEVTTIDIDDDIVQGARSALDAAGYSNVRVVHGDGALGYPDGAPYDKVIATVGVWDLPPAWLEQTGPDGDIVVPMRLRGSVTRSVAFERENGHWRSRSSEMCGFMPLRGLVDDARRVIDLAPDGTVALHVHQEQTMDPTALAGVLEQPRYESWTGVQFGGQESFEWLWLWLTCTMGNALSRMIVQPEAKDRGLVTSATGLHIMATTEEETLAYLSLRPAENTGAEAKRWEVGVIGHGIRGEDLANQVAQGIRVWNREYRSHEARFTLQPHDARAPITGQFVFHTPRSRLIISWC